MIGAKRYEDTSINSPKLTGRPEAHEIVYYLPHT